MSNLVKAALIIGGSILLATGLWIYYSPYHTCVRNSDNPNASFTCAVVTSGAYRR